MAAFLVAKEMGENQCSCASWTKSTSFPRVVRKGKGGGEGKERELQAIRLVCKGGEQRRETGGHVGVTRCTSEKNTYITSHSHKRLNWGEYPIRTADTENMSLTNVIAIEASLLSQYVILPRITIFF